MKFGLTLAETLVPEWRQHYINYDALKYKLKQAKDTPDDYLEAGQPPSTSFSIPRSVSHTHPALLQQSQQHPQHQEQQLSQQHQGHYADSSQQQHQQASAELLQQQDRQQQTLRRPGSSPGLRVPEALQIDGGPAEQFLQLLQQELNKVREFITSQGSSLQAELHALAAAAPQLAQQDCQQLEQQANELGRQLLALEAYMQLNQAGFVKICKKHDKWLPDSPIWHLYLHHLQRSPWLDDNMRQYMWAALSSCYYHLHAASIHSSRGRKPSPPVQQGQQQAQPQQPSPRVDGRTAAEQQQQGQGSAAARARAAAASSSRKVVGGLTSALGTAANAVAGAASAVAGASAAAIAAAAAAGGPHTLSVPEIVQPAYVQDSEGAETVRYTRKFWVRESDVPAVMYFVLQHLPLLPSKLHSTAAATGTEQGGRRASTDLSSSQTKRQPGLSSGQAPQQPQDTQQQQRRGATGSSQAQQHQQQLLLQPALEGFTTSLHTVYFDNTALQLYHGRLYLRPQTQTLKARWIGQDLDRQNADSVCDLGGVSAGWCPEKVVLERKLYREGWRGEPNTKDSLLIAGDKLPQYLAGAYTLGDALADLCEVPACKAQLMRASSLVRPRQQQQQPSRRALLTSPFAQANAAAAAAAAAAGSGLVLTTQQSGSVQIPGNAFSAAEAAGEDGQEDAAAAALAASVRVPHGLAIGSFSSKSMGQNSSGGGSNPSLLQLLEREQRQQQEQGERQQQANGGATLAAVATAAGCESDEQQEGFEDAYLDPPVPTADQLSLFTEVQRFVGRRRLRPVLHCMLHRMVFAMPFDDRLRITLDTDVRTTALEQDLPTAAAEWHLQQHLRQLSRNSSGGLAYAPTADSSAEISTPAAVAAAGAAVGGGAVPASGSSSSPMPPLPPRRPSSSSGILPAELQASYAIWDSIFSPNAFTDRPSTGGGLAAGQLGGQVSSGGGSFKEPGSPAYGNNSSGGGSGGGTREPAVVYPMPYALLKVSCRLQANQSTPDWLQQLMDSEAVVPIEDWSKFIHGCAVLLPETVRAVPYWMDDSVIEMSVTALQAQLEAEEARREQYRLQALQQQQHLHRNSSAGSVTAVGGASPRSGSSPLGAGHYNNHHQQQQSPILQRLSGSFRAVLARTSSGGSGGKALQHGSSGGGSLTGVQQMLPQRNLQQQQQQGGQNGGVMGVGETHSNGGRRQSRLRVSSQGAGRVPRVSWADGGQTGGSSVAGTPTHSEAAAAAGLAAEPAAESDIMWLLRKLRIVRKTKLPPLFRPEHSSSACRPRRYNPVQLLESREYLYSESVFLHWLQLAITLASVAVLLMGYSSMAYVNPLKRPAMHIAEIICCLMLPCSCVMVGYAIRSYVWRSKRLHSMRYSRVDDQIGPLVMAVVFVASMSAIMLVNIADLVLLVRAKDEPSGDDPGGGDDPEGGGGEQFETVLRVVQGALQVMRR